MEQKKREFGEVDPRTEPIRSVGPVKRRGNPWVGLAAVVVLVFLGPLLVWLYRGALGLW